MQTGSEENYKSFIAQRRKHQHVSVQPIIITLFIKHLLKNEFTKYFDSERLKKHPKDAEKKLKDIKKT